MKEIGLIASTIVLLVITSKEPCPNTDVVKYVAVDMFCNEYQVMTTKINKSIGDTLHYLKY